MSHLILIWDPLKFHHSYTLQIKLRNCGRSSAPSKMCLYIIYPLNKKWAYKAYSVKSMDIYLIISYYFYTNLNFQRPISHLILIWDPLKFHHSCTLQIKLSNFDRSTPHQDVSLQYLSNKQKMGLQSLFL